MPVQPPASVAFTVKLNTPCAVGVPLSTPPVVKFKPVGKLPPAKAKEYDPVPLLAVIVCAG